MNQEELKVRTKAFAVRVIKMTEALPRSRAANIIAEQVLRSAASVGSNYRAACRARSPKELASRLGVVEQAADESLYWLELLVETGLMDAIRLGALVQEADELTAILSEASQTARQNRRKK